MHASKQELPVTVQVGDTTIRAADWGELNVTYYAVPAGGDWNPLFKGLPEDRCQCPHWGWLLKSRLRVTYADHEETVNAGEAFYVAPGHVPHFEEETEMVEFSPKAEFQIVTDAVMRNLAGMAAPA